MTLPLEVQDHSASSHEPPQPLADAMPRARLLSDRVRALGMGVVPGGANVALPVVDARASDQLAATMRIVKAARFNAAERLESKQAVSLFTQSMVALYFVGLAVWQAVYAAQIDDATNRLVTFIQIVSSVFTLILGLLEAMNDYKLKAHFLQTCALQVSELAQELMIARPSDPAIVQEFRRRYNDVLKACPVNHAEIDYLKAKGSEKRKAAANVALTARYYLDVYGLYALFLSGPPLMWWALA